MDIRLLTIQENGEVRFGFDTFSAVEGFEKLVQAVFIEFLSVYYKRGYGEVYVSQAEVESAVQAVLSDVRKAFSDQSDINKLSEKLDNVELDKVVSQEGMFNVFLQVSSKSGTQQTLSVDLQ